jgi:hypothetical protein
MLAAMSSQNLPIAEFGFSGQLRDPLVAGILGGDKITTALGRAPEQAHS